MTKRRAQAVDTGNHVLSVFDGATMVGSLVERGGRFDAYDVDGRRLGAFADMRAAARAIPRVVSRSRS